MNCANLIGRITKDIDVRYTQQSNTIMVASFSIAIDRPVKEGAEKQTDFINIVAWGKTAEFCKKYLGKGVRIGISGRIQTRKYDDKDGKTVYVTEVIAEHVYFADGKKDDTSTYNDPFATSGNDTVTNDDLPF